MNPYYSDESVTLYHGDCREVLDSLPMVRLIVTDPPYRSLDIDVCRGTTTRLVGPQGHAPRRGDRIGSGEWFATLADDELTQIISGEIDRLPEDGAAYIFSDVKTGLRIFGPLAPNNVIVWDKMKIGMGYSWRRMHEWIGYCPRSGHTLRDKGRGDIIRVPGIDAKVHPTEKPAAVIVPLILNSSDVGDTVLDLFAGVGSTLVAAKQTGRRAIGIEIDEAFCEMAASRCSQGVLFAGGAA